MAETSLVEASAGDRPAVRALFELGTLGSYPQLAALGRITRQERLDDLFERHWEHPERRVWLARAADEGGPRGLIWLEPAVHPVSELPDWVVVMLAVHPPHQRQGLGTRLLAHALAELGGAPARLYASATNEVALRLYARLGFRPQIVELHRPHS